MTKKFPKKLAKEPLFDAVFELRFNSRAPASSVLPGFLLSKLPGSNNIEKLPAAQLPEQVRAADANLQFAPIVRFNWESFLILIGDRSIAVACKMPYPGWTAFKAGILRALKEVNETNIVESVQRFSLKYVDLIPSNDIREQVSLINMNIDIAGHKLEQEIFQVRLEIPTNDLINVIQIVSSAEITTIDNRSVTKGIIVDIDTLKPVRDEKLPNLLEKISAQLEDLHSTNVKTFFDCLKQETIDALEPIYE